MAVGPEQPDSPRTPPHDCLERRGGTTRGSSTLRASRDSQAALTTTASLDEWKNGDYLPYLFTWEAVSENAVHTLRLVPGGRASERTTVERDPLGRLLVHDRILTHQPPGTEEMPHGQPVLFV